MREKTFDDIVAQALASPRGGRPAWRGTQPANWKIVIENYLEGYHVPIAHPSLMRLIDYKRYTAEPHDGWAFFDAPFATIRPATGWNGSTSAS